MSKFYYSLGFMSGTSLDGIDASLIKSDGENFVEIIDNKLMSVVEPKLIKKENHLANVNGVLNAIKVKTGHLNSLILEGDGAGGRATSNSIISDLYEIASNTDHLSLGYSVSKLKKFESAIECYNKSLELEPNDKIVLVNKISALRKTGKINDAIEHTFQFIRKVNKYLEKAKTKVLQKILLT